jgi:hypothetical protein
MERIMIEIGSNLLTLMNHLVSASIYIIVIRYVYLFLVYCIDNNVKIVNIDIPELKIPKIDEFGLQKVESAPKTPKVKPVKKESIIAGYENGVETI